MALKALLKNKELNDKRAALAELEKTAAGFATRSAEIETAINEAKTAEEREAVEAEINDFEAAKTENEKATEALRSEIENLEKELSELEAKTEDVQPEIKEERNIKTMTINEVRSSKEYTEAYARYLKDALIHNGKADDAELRALLSENATGGAVPVPTYVETRVRQAWENNEIMNRVRKTYLKGNLKIAFEISATDAVVHTEGGEAPSEEELVLGIVNMVPASLKKWISLTTEVMDLNGSELLDYIYDEITYKIAQLAAYSLVGLIESAPTTSSSTEPGQAVIKEAPALGTIANALATLSDQAANPVVILNKATWGAFKAAQYAASFAADPFEGLPVLYCSALDAYADASEDDVYAIVGDLGAGAQANFPNGDEIKFVYDPYSLAEADLVKIVGREYVALGIVSPFAFCRITKPGA